MQQENKMPKRNKVKHDEIIGDISFSNNKKIDVKVLVEIIA